MICCGNKSLVRYPSSYRPATLTWQPVPPPGVRQDEDERIYPQEQQRVQHPKGPLPPVPLVVRLRYEEGDTQPENIDRLQRRLQVAAGSFCRSTIFCLIRGCLIVVLSPVLIFLQVLVLKQVLVLLPVFDVWLRYEQQHAQPDYVCRMRCKNIRNVTTQSFDKKKIKLENWKLESGRLNSLWFVAICSICKFTLSSGSINRGTPSQKPPARAGFANFEALTEGQKIPIHQVFLVFS